MGRHGGWKLQGARNLILLVLRSLAPSFRYITDIILFGPLQLYQVDKIVPMLQMRKLKHTMVR